MRNKKALCMRMHTKSLPNLYEYGIFLQGSRELIHIRESFDCPIMGGMMDMLESAPAHV
jgi:hypothetical protein